MGTPTTCPAGWQSHPDGCIVLGWSRWPDGTPEPAAEWTPPPAAGPPPAAPVAAGAPPTAAPGPSGTVTAAGAPEAAEPKTTRTSLFAGFLFGDTLSAALGLRPRIGLFSIQKQSTFQGTLALLIEPWLQLGVKNDRDVSFFRAGLALNLAVGWEQRLGPVELMPRVGLYNGFSFRTLTGTAAAAWSIDYSLKALLGLSFAVPAGEGTKFLLGFDAHVGDKPLFLLCAAVTF